VIDALVWDIMAQSFVQRDATSMLRVLIVIVKVFKELSGVLVMIILKDL
jgi:hypothetical protein